MTIKCRGCLRLLMKTQSVLYPRIISANSQFVYFNFRTADVTKARTHFALNMPKID